MTKGKPGICGACNHPDRARIDVGLTYGTPLRVLAKRFDLHRDALWRHKKLHLSAAMKAAILAQRPPTEIDVEALREREDGSLLANLVAQRARLAIAGEQAAELGNTLDVVRVETAVCQNLKLTAQLLGQLTQHYS